MALSKRSRDAVAFVALVAAGVGLLYLRDPHSLLVPTLYTEDGAWMAKLFNRGFWHTILHAKGGDTPYFVFLNILLLQAAKSLNAAWHGDSLAHLPHFVSALAMTFYAALAAAPVWLLRGRLDPAARALLWALVIFMPLGDSSFEILGRVSNIGYGLLFLCVCLLAWRRTADPTRPGPIVAADGALLLCATSNPLCYPVIAADFLDRGIRAWRAGLTPAAVLRANVAARSGLGLLLALAGSVAAMAALEARPNPFLRDGLRPDELVEAIVARSLLFPVVFPFYGRLGDPLALGIGAVLVATAWWLTRESVSERRFAAAATMTAACAAAVTVAARPGLTRLLDHYSTTRLDRYYYGTSLLVAAAVCAAISAGLRSRGPLRRLVAGGCLVAVVTLYAANAGTLVEFRHSRWADLPARDFASAVASAAADRELADRVAVQLHPRTWQARFPAANVRATAIAIAPDTIRR